MAPADTSSTTSRDVAVEELSKAVATVPVRNARSTFDVDACMIYLSLVPNASLRPPDICLSANDDRAMPPIKPDATWNQSMDSSFDILARISLEWICSAGKKVVCLPLFVSLYAKCVTICIVCAAFLGVLHCASKILDRYGLGAERHLLRNDSRAVSSLLHSHAGVAMYIHEAIATANICSWLYISFRAIPSLPWHSHQEMRLAKLAGGRTQGSSVSYYT